MAVSSWKAAFVMGESEGSKGGSSSRGVTHAAVIGYGPDAREQALRLRAMGWEVDVVVRSGGMTWIHAVADGFRPVPAAEATLRADVVVVHLPESEQPSVWAYSLAPYLAAGSLVVFAHGSALYSGAVLPDPGLDVALVTPCAARGGERVCRVAVQRDATGQALERALAFARAAFGSIKVETTTVDSEVTADLSALGAKMGGGLPALMAEWDRVLASPSHEPDEATLTYYERLRAMVLAGGRKRGAA
jgi:ketol-acid reductoisomerase